MKYAFFGSPVFAAIILEKLINAGTPPALVVCNPDKPTGRKKNITPPPVKQLIANSHAYRQAGKLQIEILQPEDPRLIIDKLALMDADFFIVAAYAKILPKEIVEMPRLGIIGVHPSLLPKYRGATPIQSAILAGEIQTGTTLFLLDEKIDHGPLIASRQTQIANSDTYEALMGKLANLSGDLLIESLPKYINGEIKPVEQNHSEATFTKKITTEDGLVDLLNNDPVIVERKIKALNPDPGVYTFYMKNNKKIRVKLLSAELLDGKLKLITVQVEGKKPVPAEQLPQLIVTGT